MQVCEPFGRIDLIGDGLPRLRFRALLDLRRAESGNPHMCKIESLVEAYLIAERTLVEAVDAAGGKVPLPDGRTVTVGRAEFDALSSGRRDWISTVSSGGRAPNLKDLAHRVAIAPDFLANVRVPHHAGCDARAHRRTR